MLVAVGRDTSREALELRDLVVRGELLARVGESLRLSDAITSVRHGELFVCCAIKTRRQQRAPSGRLEEGFEKVVGYGQAYRCIEEQVRLYSGQEGRTCVRNKIPIRISNKGNVVRRRTARTYGI